MNFGMYSGFTKLNSFANASSNAINANGVMTFTAGNPITAGSLVWYRPTTGKVYASNNTVGQSGLPIEAGVNYFSNFNKTGIQYAPFLTSPAIPNAINYSVYSSNSAANGYPFTDAGCIVAELSSGPGNFVTSYCGNTTQAYCKADIFYNSNGTYLTANNINPTYYYQAKVATFTDNNRFMVVSANTTGGYQASFYEGNGSLITTTTYTGITNIAAGGATAPQYDLCSVTANNEVWLYAVENATAANATLRRFTSSGVLIANVTSIGSGTGTTTTVSLKPLANGDIGLVGHTGSGQLAFRRYFANGTLNVANTSVSAAPIFPTTYYGTPRETWTELLNGSLVFSFVGTDGASSSWPNVIIANSTGGSATANLAYNAQLGLGGFTAPFTMPAVARTGNNFMVAYSSGGLAYGVATNTGIIISVSNANTSTSNSLFFPCLRLETHPANNQVVMAIATSSQGANAATSYIMPVVNINGTITDTLATNTAGFPSWHIQSSIGTTTPVNGKFSSDGHWLYCTVGRATILSPAEPSGVIGVALSSGANGTQVLVGTQGTFNLSTSSQTSLGLTYITQSNTNTNVAFYSNSVGSNGYLTGSTLYLSGLPQ